MNTVLRSPATVLLLLLAACACTGADTPPNETGNATPELVSSELVAGATVPVTLHEVTLVFGQRIALINKAKITLNSLSVQNASAKNDTLSVQWGSLEAQTSYTLTVEPGAIKAIPGVMSKEAISITFATAEMPEPPELVVSYPSPEAVTLYNFLKESFGEKIISGAMANVSWNISEAEWVHQRTGKYPALNGFDYIHHHETSWADYSNTKVVEDWWNDNGLVTICWHWNVPKTQGSAEYAFYTSKGNDKSFTTFDIAKAVQDGTDENSIVKADLETIAGHLWLLKQKNIPVLWRPLHEAAGGWFWWGAKGHEPLKALWKLMFETFEAKGLNNLIWVWTAEPNDAAWYPGDEYVDIVGRDVYNKTTAAAMADEYATLKSRFPHKIVTLSECGNVANLQDQTAQGVRWSWFMPWYDYNRTNNPAGAAFSSTDHLYAPAAWWINAFNDPRVLSRDELKVKN
jgi:mannan endo-1,4-beta-mannosidase